jgi:hypothetical protein
MIHEFEQQFQALVACQVFVEPAVCIVRRFETAELFCGSLHW